MGDTVVVVFFHQLRVEIFILHLLHIQIFLAVVAGAFHQKWTDFFTKHNVGELLSSLVKLLGALTLPLTKLIASGDTVIASNDNVSDFVFIVPSEPCEARGDGVAVGRVAVDTDSGIG
jgi:hypothetical protein